MPERLFRGHQVVCCWGRNSRRNGAVESVSLLYLESQFHVQGNKGGTAIRLSFTPPGPSNSERASKAAIGSTSLTFVNAHLAAFDEMVDKRNSDFQDLS